MVAAVRTSFALSAGFCLGRNQPFLWSVFGAWAVAAAQVGIDSAAAGGVKALGKGCTGCLGLSLVSWIEAA